MNSLLSKLYNYVSYTILSSLNLKATMEATSLTSDFNEKSLLRAGGAAIDEVISDIGHPPQPSGCTLQETKDMLQKYNRVGWNLAGLDVEPFSVPTQKRLQNLELAILSLQGIERNAHVAAEGRNEENIALDSLGRLSGTACCIRYAKQATERIFSAVRGAQ